MEDPRRGNLRRLTWFMIVLAGASIMGLVVGVLHAGRAFGAAGEALTRVEAHQHIDAVARELKMHGRAVSLSAIVQQRRELGLHGLALLDERGGTLQAAGDLTVGALPEGPARLLRSGARLRVVSPPVLVEAGVVRVVAVHEPAATDPVGRSILALLLLGLLAAGALGGLAVLLMKFVRLRDDLLIDAARRDHLAHLGEMSAVLAHELKNPLAALKGHTQLLLESLSDSAPSASRARAKAEAIVGQAVRLENLIRELLDFSRSGLGERCAVDLLSFVQKVLLESRAGAGPGDVHIVADANDRPYVTMDADRLGRALMNIVQNAREAAPGRPVLIAVARARGRAVITVSDEGPGVPPEHRSKLFMPFFTTKAQGTGLGLAHARRIIELHGGGVRLEVRGDDQRGTMVTVELPEARR